MFHYLSKKMWTTESLASRGRATGPAMVPWTALIKEGLLPRNSTFFPKK